MRSLSTMERKLLIIQTFYILSVSLAGIFVTLFFYGNSNLATTALFRVITYISMTFFYTSSGFLLRYMSSGALIRTGIIGGGIFYLLLFILGKESVSWFPLLGILDGFAGGLFWSGFNLNLYILSSSGKRVAFMGWGHALYQLVNGVGPALGGAIILFARQVTPWEVGGYITLFILVSMLLFLVALLVGRLPGHEPPSFSYKHIVRHERSPLWKIILGQQAISGFYDALYGSISGILLYLIVRNESALGIMLSAGALIATISSIVVTRALIRYPKIYWLGAVGSAVSIFVFALNQNMMGAIFMIALSSATVPFFMTKLGTDYFDVLDKMPGTWREKYHYMIERDGVLGIFRMIGYAMLFFFVQLGDEVAMAQLFLFIIPFFPLANACLLYISNRHQKHGIPLPTSHVANVV